MAIELYEYVVEKVEMKRLHYFDSNVTGAYTMCEIKSVGVSEWKKSRVNECCNKFKWLYFISYGRVPVNTEGDSEQRILIKISTSLRPAEARKLLNN